MNLNTDFVIASTPARAFDSAGSDTAAGATYSTRLDLNVITSARGLRSSHAGMNSGMDLTVPIVDFTRRSLKAARSHRKTSQKRSRTEERSQLADPGTYGARVNECGCRSVPESQHVPGCTGNDTRSAPQCENCGYRGRWDHGVCPHCGFLSGCPARHPNKPGVWQTICEHGVVLRWTNDDDTGDATDSYYKEWCPVHGQD